MKQIAKPMPKAVVTALRCRVHSLGSAIRSPKGRRNQRFWNDPGEGQSFFNRRRGMRRADCTRTIRKEAVPVRKGSFYTPATGMLDKVMEGCDGFASIAAQSCIRVERGVSR